MEVLRGFTALWLLVAWSFATVSNCQGGSFGFAPTSCDIYNVLSTNYLGCFQTGNDSFPDTPWSLVGPNNPAINFGRGPTTIGAMLITTSGTGATSFPGFVTGGVDLWWDSTTQYNCTMVCRSHGMKYTIITDGICSCSPYNGAMIQFHFLGSGIDDMLNSASGACQVPRNPIQNFGSNRDVGGGGFTWQNGHYAGGSVSGWWGSMYWVDASMADDLYIDYAYEATNYGYLGCFIMPDSATSFQPQGYTNVFASTAGCYTFCSSLNMPYAGMAYTSGA
jgi:hypothetical protein